MNPEELARLIHQSVMSTSLKAPKTPFPFPTLYTDVAVKIVGEHRRCIINHCLPQALCLYAKGETTEDPFLRSNVSSDTLYFTPSRYRRETIQLAGRREDNSHSYKLANDLISKLFQILPQGISTITVYSSPPKPASEEDYPDLVWYYKSELRVDIHLGKHLKG